jgi:hypothetical protein
MLELQHEFFDAKKMLINARSNFTRKLFRTNLESVKMFGAALTRWNLVFQILNNSFIIAK